MKTSQLSSLCCTSKLILRLKRHIEISYLVHSTGDIIMRDNKGFTLIELLIVVVIIGILAAIAIPKFSATREKAYFAAMKSDMKNLASQQEIYYSETYEYSSNTTSLGFVSSSGVTVSIAPGTAGWAATAIHAALATSEGCSIYYGTGVSPTAVGTALPGAPGEMDCTQ